MREGSRLCAAMRSCGTSRLARQNSTQSSLQPFSCGLAPMKLSRAQPKRGCSPARRHGPARRDSRRLEAIEAADEVGEQVRGILEADLQAQQRPAVPGSCHARVAPEVRRACKALVTAPAVAQRE